MVGCFVFSLGFWVIPDYAQGLLEHSREFYCYLCKVFVYGYDVDCLKSKTKDIEVVYLKGAVANQSCKS